MTLDTLTVHSVKWSQIGSSPSVLSSKLSASPRSSQSPRQLFYTFSSILKLPTFLVSSSLSADSIAFIFSEKIQKWKTSSSFCCVYLLPTPLPVYLPSPCKEVFLCCPIEMCILTPSFQPLALFSFIVLLISSCAVYLEGKLQEGINFVYFL